VPPHADGVGGTGGPLAPSGLLVPQGVSLDLRAARRLGAAGQRATGQHRFFCRNVQASTPTWWYASSLGLQGWQGAALHPALQRRFALQAVLALRLPSAGLTGHLFFLDKRHLTGDDLRLGAVVTRHVVARLEDFSVVERRQQGAAMAERIALARDLHDGLLQSLTGAALQLEIVHHLLGKDPQGAKERLLQVQRLFAEEQRELRAFIQGLKLPRLHGPASIAACGYGRPRPGLLGASLGQLPQLAKEGIDDTVCV
jgi:signal transduction histidine kinase